MAGIFTRKALSAILAEETTPEEKVDALFSLYGRAIDDGYVTKSPKGMVIENGVYVGLD